MAQESEVFKVALQDETKHMTKLTNKLVNKLVKNSRSSSWKPYFSKYFETNFYSYLSTPLILINLEVTTMKSSMLFSKTGNIFLSKIEMLLLIRYSVTIQTEHNVDEK